MFVPCEKLWQGPSERGDHQQELEDSDPWGRRPLGSYWKSTDTQQYVKSVLTVSEKQCGVGFGRNTIATQIVSSWLQHKIIPDHRLVPTFYKLSVGGCPHQHSLTVTETWTLYIDITCCNEIHRSVCTTSNQQQVPFCRWCLFWKKILFVSLPVHTDFCLHLQKTVSMRTTRCW